MTRVRVDLAFAGGGDWVMLEELTGAVEASVQGVGTAAAIALLDDLLCDVAETAFRPGEASALTAPDRDRVLVAMYQHAYGDIVERTVRCGACSSRFDIDFTLSDLVGSLAVERPSEFDDSRRSLYRLEDGTRFRLPTGADELAVVGIDRDSGVQRLMESCLMPGSAEPNLETVQAVMASVAPTIDLDLEVACPECGVEQQWRFDVQVHVLSALRNERPRLVTEVHTLAKAYGWSFDEIMSTPRSLRKDFVAIASGTIPEWVV